MKLRAALQAIGQAPEALRNLPSLAELTHGSTVRLAVTGLSRSGKTVFITSLIHNLLSAALQSGRMPLLRAARENRLVSAVLEGAAAQTVAPFPYKANIQRMTAVPPMWPVATEGISETEISIRFRPHGFTRYFAAVAGSEATLLLKLVDYPGEWLLDLPLLRQSYAEWSRATLELCRGGSRAEVAAPWLAALASADPAGPAQEDHAKRLHDLYRAFLMACRDRFGLSFLQPGRFVCPGDMASSEPPFLWFCPLDLPGGDARLPPGSLAALMAQRYDIYRREVVERFYRDHFRSFQRQIVLVDILRALLGGADAFDDTRRALEAILESFRYGSRSFLPALFGARIEKLLFAATKADHVTRVQRDHLAHLLGSLVAMPRLQAKGGSARTEVMPLASVLSTEDGMDMIGGHRVDVVVGRPLGRDKRIKFFPGPIPTRPPADAYWGERFLDIPVFEPPALAGAPVDGIPHVNLDAALQFLIGDKLA